MIYFIDNYQFLIKIYTKEKNSTFDKIVIYENPKENFF